LAVLFSLVAVFWRAKRVGLNQNTQGKERDFKDVGHLPQILNVKLTSD